MQAPRTLRAATGTRVVTVPEIREAIRFKRAAMRQAAGWGLHSRADFLAEALYDLEEDLAAALRGEVVEWDA